jgi:hypothetical protein
LLREESIPALAKVSLNTKKNRIVLAIEKKVRVFDEDGQPTGASVELSANATAVALSPNGQLIAAPTEQGEIVVTDGKPGATRALKIDKTENGLPARGPSSVLFLDNATIVTCDDNGVLSLWDIATGTARWQEKAHESGCLPIADSVGFLSLTMTELTRWEIDHGKPRAIAHLVFPDKVVGVSYKELPQVLTIKGEWMTLGDDGSELARVVMPLVTPLDPGSASATTMWFVDRKLNLCAMDRPLSVSPQELHSLAVQRGIWTLVDGRLTSRRPPE